VWLLVIGVEMLYSLLNLSYFTWLPDLIIIPLCYGPFLLFYTKLLISRNPKFPSKFLPHLSPLLLFLLISLVWGNPINIDAVNFLQKGSITILALANYLLFFVSMLYYWWVVFRKINAHNQTLSDHFSYRSDTVKLTWLKTIALWILGAFIGSAITFFMFFLKNIFPFNPIEIFHLGLLVFTFSISYYGIHQPILYQQRATKPRSREQVEIVDRSELNVEFGERIKSVMTSKGLHLNNELTVQHIADEMGVTTTVISNYLNKELGINFFNYVNGFRIEEAKSRLSNPNHSTDTLLCIAFDSGFNSKSSFNSLFKKETGMTPSEYRRVYGELNKTN
jgi:AraC-like DNA-binding protein